MNIAIVLFPDMEELDFAGPLEVFGMAAKAMYKDWRVFTVAQEPVVRGAIGLSVNAEFTFEDAPHADVVVVPGGFGTRAGMENQGLASAGPQATAVIAAPEHGRAVAVDVVAADLADRAHETIDRADSRAWPGRDALAVARDVSRHGQGLASLRSLGNVVSQGEPSVQAIVA